MAKSALVALGILPNGTKRRIYDARCGRARRFASGEHAPATALAASQPLEDSTTRRASKAADDDGPAFASAGPPLVRPCDKRSALHRRRDPIATNNDNGRLRCAIRLFLPA